jgi:hypothetical protein
MPLTPSFLSSNAHETSSKIFFAYLLQDNAYTHTNRRKTKFRWLLLASLKHYIADIWDPGEHSSETAIMRSCSWMRKFMRLRRATRANPYMSG